MVKPKRKRMKYYSVNIDGTLRKSDKEKLVGISGWLDLWAIYFVLMALSIFIKLNIGIFTDWELFSSSLTSNLFSLVYIFLSIWLIFSFFTKKRLFILSVNIFLVLSILGNLAEGSFVWLVIDFIWLGYFYRSKRVKNTFVN